MSNRLFTMIGLTSLTLAGVAMPSGCTPYRIEHHTRPTIGSVLGDRPEEVRLEDGTVIRYASGNRRTTPKRSSSDAKPARIREEHEDGTVELRAWVPQDVLSNYLACLRNREYELFWDQMIADITKQEYEARGRDDGKQEFMEFCQKNRNELVASLNRMIAGLPRNEALVENAGNGILRVRLYPPIAKGYVFTSADIVREIGGMKLAIIR